MTVSAIAVAFCAAMLACIPLGRILWRKHKAGLHETDRKWQAHQAARLESLLDRMKVEVDPAPVDYPELPRVHLAGLLSPPCDLPPEPL